ncbi:MAG: glycosyltransferase family 2 protein [Candidatus Sulfotelmatobacter sp.]
MATLPRYVLITPARNEAQFIELCLQSVVSQTVKPVRWVIVSDGSTDGTDEIVGRYAAENTWIELVRMPERRERNFAGKVHAFNAGYEKLQGLEYEVIGSLDGDASFDSEYFSFLLAKLNADPALGLVGTPFREGAGRVYDYRFVSQEHVSGICQLFRRQCFQDIGGYVAVKGGSIDHIAVITARMKGWKTRTFTEKECIHHREIAKAQGGALKSKFKYGGKDYALGNHPCWELSRVAYQMTKKPYLAGGLALGAGYAWSAIRRVERPVSAEFVAFHRGEQWQRLKRFFRANKNSATPVWPRSVEHTK